MGLCTEDPSMYVINNQKITNISLNSQLGEGEFIEVKGMPVSNGALFTKVPERQFSLSGYQMSCWNLAMPTARTVDYLGMGLAGEVGEVLSLYAKAIRDEHEVSTEDLKKELGDCCWFIACLCTSAGLKLEDVMQANLKKLYSRKERGTLKGSGDNR